MPCPLSLPGSSRSEYLGDPSFLPYSAVIGMNVIKWQCSLCVCYQCVIVYMCIFKIMLYEHISMFLNMFYPVENVSIQIWFLLLLALCFCSI